MSIADFLFPCHTCLVCGCELNAPSNVYLCDACANTLPTNTKPVTLVDSEQTQYFTRAFAPFKYDEPITKLIMQIKYSNNALIAQTVAPYMAACWSKDNSSKDYVLVPVPLCAKRLKTRGYNQSKLIASEIAKYLNVPVAEVLIRTKETVVQKNMSVKQRADNMRGAFGITPDARIPRKYIVVDDVFTTGATANECARILIKHGAKQVDVLTIARVWYE